MYFRPPAKAEWLIKHNNRHAIDKGLPRILMIQGLNLSKLSKIWNFDDKAGFYPDLFISGCRKSLGVRDAFKFS